MSLSQRLPWGFLSNAIFWDLNFFVMLGWHSGNTWLSITDKSVWSLSFNVTILCWSLSVILSSLEIVSDIVFFEFFFAIITWRRSCYWMIWMVVFANILETWSELDWNCHPLPEKYAPWNMVSLHYYFPHLYSTLFVVQFQSKNQQIFYWFENFLARQSLLSQYFFPQFSITI